MHIVSSRTNRFFFLLLVLMTSISATAQSPSKNYVQTKTFLDAAGTTFLRHIDYYDELGFVSETVDVGGNTSQPPLVVKTDYTTQMKPSFQWAPVPATGLEHVADVTNVARTAYSDYRPYIENVYDDFQELASTWKPGNAWEERPVTMVRKVVPSGEVRKHRRFQWQPLRRRDISIRPADEYHDHRRGRAERYGVHQHAREHRP